MLTLGINSYVTLDEANTYAEQQGFDLITEDHALTRATKWIDRTFGHRFIGSRQVVGQPLSWPRYPGAYHFSETSCLTVDSDGNPIDLSSVPAAVKEATIEVALMMQDGADMYVQPSPAVKQESTTVDVITTSKVYATSYLPKASGNVDLYKIELILRPVLGAGSLRLVR